MTSIAMKKDRTKRQLGFYIKKLRISSFDH